MQSSLPAPVSIEEKRQALLRVLGSRGFGRSEQLRAFLRYVCDAEMEGRGHEVNEYALGVSVLRRPAGYSPAEAELMWALAEAVTNPEHVSDIMSQLRTPSAQYAESFQVVIRATFQSNVPVKIRYVTHHILHPS